MNMPVNEFTNDQPIYAPLESNTSMPAEMTYTNNNFVPAQSPDIYNNIVQAQSTNPHNFMAAQKSYTSNTEQEAPYPLGYSGRPNARYFSETRSPYAYSRKSTAYHCEPSREPEMRRLGEPYDSDRYRYSYSSHRYGRERYSRKRTQRPRSHYNRHGPRRSRSYHEPPTKKPRARLSANHPYRSRSEHRLRSSQYQSDSDFHSSQMPLPTHHRSYPISTSAYTDHASRVMGSRSPSRDPRTLRWNSQPSDRHEFSGSNNISRRTHVSRTRTVDRNKFRRPYGPEDLY